MNVTARAPMEYAVISVVHWWSPLSGLLRSLRRILRFVKKATTSRIRYATTSGAPPSIAHAFHCTSTNSQSFSGDETIAQVRVNHSPSSQAGTEEIREGEICQIFDFHAAILIDLRRIIGRECLESTPNLFRSERDAQAKPPSTIDPKTTVKPALAPRRRWFCRRKSKTNRVMMTSTRTTRFWLK